MTKKTNLAMMVLVAGIASLVIGTAYSTQIFAVESEEPKPTIIDFSPKIPDGPFVMKRGESLTIPLEILAPAHKQGNIQVYVNEPEVVPSGPSQIKEERFSEGISASASKRTVSMIAEEPPNIDYSGERAPFEVKVRDSMPVTITASNDASIGEHMFTVTLFEETNEGRKFITLYIPVIIEN